VGDPSLRGHELRVFFPPLRGFDLRSPLLDRIDEVVDDVGVFQAVVGDATDVDLVGSVAAAGEADVGFARLARPLTTQPMTRDGEWRRDVREALIEPAILSEIKAALADAGYGKRDSG
jgi:hypothetical protein